MDTELPTLWVKDLSYITENIIYCLVAILQNVTSEEYSRISEIKTEQNASFAIASVVHEDELIDWIILMQEPLFYWYALKVL